MGPSSQPKTAEVHYTVFVRVPFPRGDFVDPPAVHWDSSKDRALWKILSSSSKDAEIDWHALAEEFDVTLPFLLQQAAWLYERQLSQVREQLRKVNQPTSSRGSPAPVSASGSTTVGDQAMRRVGSGGMAFSNVMSPFTKLTVAGSRVPSSLSMRTRDNPIVQSGGPGTPVPARAPPYSRTGSTNVIPQSRKSTASPLNNPSRRSLEAVTRPPISTDLHPKGDMAPRSPSPAAASSPSSSSISSSEPHPLSHSRAFTRRPRFPTQKSKPRTQLGLLSSASEEASDASDDTPAFLPFSANAASSGPQSPQDPSATLRRIPSNPSRRETSTINTATGSRPGTATNTTARPVSQGKENLRSNRPPPQQTKTATTHSSSSSSLSSPFPSNSNTHSQSHPLSSPPPGPTSPAAGPISALSPRARRIAREGSEGTPSMGSSFSDLDDASVTQSALEEALAREIKEGGGSLGVVGRMGGLWRGRKGGRGG